MNGARMLRATEMAGIGSGGRSMRQGLGFAIVGHLVVAVLTLEAELPTLGFCFTCWTSMEREDNGTRSAHL